MLFLAPVQSEVSGGLLNKDVANPGHGLRVWAPTHSCQGEKRGLLTWSLPPGGRRPRVWHRDGRADGGGEGRGRGEAGRELIRSRTSFVVVGGIFVSPWLVPVESKGAMREAGGQGPHPGHLVWSLQGLCQDSAVMGGLVVGHVVGSASRAQWENWLQRSL